MKNRFNIGKYLVAFCLVTLSSVSSFSAWADDLENNYAWVLAGILNQISPQLGEVKSLNMLGACSYIMPNYLQDQYGVTDETKQTEIANALVKKYHQEGKNILDWDSTIAESMEKRVSIEELKQLDATIKNDTVRQCIIKSEKISEFIYCPDFKKEIVSWILSKAKGTFAFNRVKVNKCEKSYLESFERFYSESGNKQDVSEMIDGVINGMLESEAIRSQKNFVSYMKELDKWKPDFENRIYTMMLNRSIEELTEQELIESTKQYQSGILVKYMSVTRKLQLNPALYIEPYLNRFAKFVETQDELIKQLVLTKKKTNTVRGRKRG